MRWIVSGVEMRDARTIGVARIGSSSQRSIPLRVPCVAIPEIVRQGRIAWILLVWFGRRARQPGRNRAGSPDEPLLPEIRLGEFDLAGAGNTQPFLQQLMANVPWIGDLGRRGIVRFRLRGEHVPTRLRRNASPLLPHPNAGEQRVNGETESCSVHAQHRTRCTRLHLDQQAKLPAAIRHLRPLF